MGTPAVEVAAERTRADLEANNLEVTNIVATVDFDREFDLNNLSESLPNSDYDPESTPFVIYRTNEATMMIPRTGKVSAVGANSIDEVYDALESLADDLNGIGAVVRSVEPVVENIVVNGSVGGDIVLEAVVIGLGLENTEYEPEQFPGLIYRPAEKATVLLFQSGTFVLTGLTNYSDVWDVAQRFTVTLDEVGVSNVNVVDD